MDALRSELLDDVAAHAKQILADHGIADDVADQCGIALAEFLAEHWGGQLINFPKNFLYKLAQRDMDIYEEFTGNNHAKLALKHGMTTRGIYKLINRAHKRIVAEKQPDLFPD
ncbi:Mor transcription activator family protein [Rheinheimera baltica]|uniref:Mor transcription activator family protein n=1 Tax=Rheinheimera baltica TaxID=67576 RepID=UPI0003FB2713|nr:Mor transcription activator family protein [Rheinheimera baltica]